MLTRFIICESHESATIGFNRGFFSYYAQKISHFGIGVAAIWLEPKTKKRGQPISRLPSNVVQKRPSGHTGKVILRL